MPADEVVSVRGCPRPEDETTAHSTIPGQFTDYSQFSARPERTKIPFRALRKWQGRRDSNPRPSVLETDALPTELHPYTHQRC